MCKHLANKELPQLIKPVLKLNVVSSNLIGRLTPTRLNASPGFSFVLILQGFTLADWQLAAKQHIP